MTAPKTIIQTFLSTRKVSLEILAISLFVSGITYSFAVQNFGIFHLVQYDDSYVTYRYSLNLAIGNGMRFNPGDPTNSASSFLFTCLLALAGFIYSPNSIPKISLFISLVSFVLLLTALGQVLKTKKNNIKNSWIFLLASFAISTNSYVQYWLISGMETIFFIALLIGVMFTPTLVKSTSDRWWTRWVASGLFAGLAITRVEGFLVAMTVSLIWLYREFKFGSSIQVRKLPTFVAVSTLATFALLIAFNYAYYGQILGDPVLFKPLVQYYATTPIQAVSTTIEFFLTHNRVVLVVFITALLLRVLQGIARRKLRFTFAEILAFSVATLYFCYLSQVPNSDFYRYQLPLLIVVVILTVELLSNIDLNLPLLDRKSIRILSISTVMFAFLFTTFQSNRTELESLVPSTSKYLYVQEARINAGMWLESNTPPGSRVLAGDIGALAFYNPSNVFIDSAGLVNRQLLETVIAGEDYSKAIRDRSPDYIADTSGPDGLTASESIYDKPQSYYLPSETNVYSGCNIANSTSQEALGRFPDESNETLFIKIVRVYWSECGL